MVGRQPTRSKSFRRVYTGRPISIDDIPWRAEAVISVQKNVHNYGTPCNGSVDGKGRRTPSEKEVNIRHARVFVNDCATLIPIGCLYSLVMMGMTCLIKGNRFMNLFVYTPPLD